MQGGASGMRDPCPAYLSVEQGVYVEFNQIIPFSLKFWLLFILAFYVLTLHTKCGPESKRGPRNAGTWNTMWTLWICGHYVHTVLFAVLKRRILRKLSLLVIQNEGFQIVRFPYLYNWLKRSFRVIWRFIDFFLLSGLGIVLTPPPFPEKSGMN